MFGHAIPNKGASVLISGGAEEADVCKHTQLGGAEEAELILL